MSRHRVRALRTKCVTYGRFVTVTTVTSGHRREACAITERSSPGSPAERQSSEATGNRASGQAVYVGSEIHRRVSVPSSSGEPATIMVTVRWGKVRMSIVPYFTEEAILDPEKVDVVIRTLVQARDDARRMRSVRPKPQGGSGAVMESDSS